MRRNPKRSVYSLLFLSLTAAPAAAQDVQILSLEDALQLFAANNVELRIARSRADQALGAADQARAVPNPSLNATHEPLSGQGASYSETYLTVSQRLELPGSRSARAEAARQRYESARLLVSADSLRLAFEVKRAYAGAVLAQELRAVAGRVADVFRDAALSATERYEDGDISLYSLRRIELERARYETAVAETEIEVGVAQRALALLVDPSAHASGVSATDFPTTMPEVPDLPRIPAVGVERRPELAAARAEVEALAAEGRLMRAERLPDVTATGGFKRQSDGLSGLLLGVSLPLPLFDRSGGAIRSADAALRAAEERLELTRLQIEAEISRASDTYQLLARRAELSTTGVAGGAGDLLDIASVAYEEGAMELVELLDAADALYQARTRDARSRAALWVASFELERALGGFGQGEGVQ